MNGNSLSYYMKIINLEIIRSEILNFHTNIFMFLSIDMFYFIREKYFIVVAQIMLKNDFPHLIISLNNFASNVSISIFENQRFPF